MRDGYGTQLTRQIGEHLVVAELGRRGILAAPFAGNVPGYDLLASDLSGHSLPLQVKTINGRSWQFSITNFLDIEFGGRKQFVRGKKNLRDPNLIYVFVSLKREANDEFYIWTAHDLQEHLHKGYSGFLEKHHNERPNAPKSVHCAIWAKDLREYQDNWELITSHFDAIR